MDQFTENLYSNAIPFVTGQIIIFGLLLFAFMRLKKYAVCVQMVFLYLAVYYLLFLTTQLYTVVYIDALAMAIGFAEGPIVFWLVLNFTVGDQKKVSFWHWVPMGLSLGLFLIDPKHMHDSLYITVSISRIVYGFICLRLLWGVWAEVNNTTWHQWVLTIVFYMLVLASIKLVSFIIFLADGSWYVPRWIIFAKTTGAASVILLMLWWALLKPSIFDEARSQRYSNRAPTEFEKETYEKLIEIFEREKLYLDSSLNLDNVAARLAVTQREFSEAVNKVYGDGFRSLLRKYRIEKSCEILTSEENKDITILNVAMLSGFSTKSVFNAAFKSQVGVNPSEFRQRSLSK